MIYFPIHFFTAGDCKPFVQYYIIKTVMKKHEITGVNEHIHFWFSLTKKYTFLQSIIVGEKFKSLFSSCLCKEKYYKEKPKIKKNYKPNLLKKLIFLNQHKSKSFFCQIYEKVLIFDPLIYYHTIDIPIGDSVGKRTM